VNWEFILWLDGELMFGHKFTPAGLNVHFYYLPSGMGDRIALFPYMEEFRKRWNCNASCTVEPYLQKIVRLYFPQVQCSPAPVDSYATYFLAPGFSPLFYADEVRKVPMVKFGEQILGLAAKKITYRPTKPRQIAEPYVCIAAQASITVKTWLNPDGWSAVIDYLKQLGYRVLCIDRDRQQTDHGFTVKMPEGAEDFTGNLPLIERANMLYHAEFFIGLSSGLAWLAKAVNCPVVMIGGFTKDWHEFYTPYRVANLFVCNGCFNDMHVWFIVDVCPYHRGTPRELECQKKIFPQQVINAIDRLIADRGLKPPLIG